MKVWAPLKKTKLYRFIFGFDLFISYSRKDSLDYAYKLAEYFINKGYECYIDQLSNIMPGAKLPENITNAIKSARAIVIIGSAGSQKSYPIAEEIECFLHYRKNRPLIPINIDNAVPEADWYKKIEGLALINELKANHIIKAPSKDVLNRIQNSLTFTRKSIKLRNIAIIIFGVALLMTLYIFIQTSTARKEIKRANQATSDRIAADSLKKNALDSLLKVSSELAKQQRQLDIQLIGSNYQDAFSYQKAKQYKHALETYSLAAKIASKKEYDSIPEVTAYRKKLEIKIVECQSQSKK